MHRIERGVVRLYVVVWVGWFVAGGVMSVERMVGDPAFVARWVVASVVVPGLVLAAGRWVARGFSRPRP